MSAIVLKTTFYPSMTVATYPPWMIALFNSRKALIVRDDVGGKSKLVVDTGRHRAEVPPYGILTMHADGSFTVET